MNDQIKKYSILIVDDEVYIRDFISEVLSDYYHVYTACDGREAIAFISQSPPKPLILVLDISMPGLSGIEVCKSVRKIAGFEKSPILVMTAFNSLEKRSAAMVAGASDFLSKPFHPDELLAKIKALIDM